MKLAERDSVMGLWVVGVGDCRHALDESDTLVTYALGSCIAVGIWDPVSKVTGLLHFVLPQSSSERGARASEHPFRYADTGTPLLFRRAYALGADKRRLQVYLAGGASVVDEGGLFNVGKRNHTAIRKLLWKAGVLVHGEDVGGAIFTDCSSSFILWEVRYLHAGKNRYRDEGHHFDPRRAGLRREDRHAEGRPNCG